MTRFTPRLRNLLTLVVGSGLMLSTAAIAYIGQQQQADSLRQAFYSRIYWVSESFGYKSVENVVTHNWATLELSVVDVLKRQPEVAYVFVRAPDGEILAAVDGTLIEEYDPQLIAWSTPASITLEKRLGQPSDELRTRDYTGDYHLCERLLLTDAVVDGEVRARAGETVLESELKLMYLGNFVGTLNVGFSQGPLTQTLDANRETLLELELGILLLGLLISISVAWLVASPLQRMAQQLMGASPSHQTPLEDLERQLQSLDLRDIPASTHEAQQLIEAFSNMQQELLVQLHRVRLSEEELLASNHSLQTTNAELQRTEEKLRTRNTELQEANAELQRTQSQLVQSTKMATMGEMLAMIAHQWRQPLATINMIVAILKVQLKQQPTKPEKQLEQLHKIEQTTQFLSKTINDFRDFFRPDKELEVVRLQDLLLRSLSMIESILERHSVQVHSEFCELKPLVTYPSELQQVLLNLLKNAQEALEDNEPGHRHLTLRLYSDQGAQVLEVQDNAGGIPSEIVEKIFHPYFTTKGKLNGTGLGLYMSKMIIEDHLNGKLTVENRDQGACFSIRLPAEESLP